jgi:uncharacterized membrane protein
LIKYEGPATRYSHAGDEPINLNEEFIEQLSMGQRLADVVGRCYGCWKFIIIQTIVIFIWAMANLYFLSTQEQFDPYPFILLNLVMSLEAAYSTPIIMMSQNRQAEKDRLSAELDYQTNKKAEKEIKVIMDQLIYLTKIIIEKEVTK